MRKLILLFALIAFSLKSIGQIIPVSLYHESFDTVNAMYKVTHGLTTIVGATASNITWNDTTAQFTNPMHSYHVSGDFTGNEVWFETDPVSTMGFPYVFFSFNQIAKLFLANEGRVSISTDGGVTFVAIPERHYIGSDVSRSALYVANEYYNAGSYVIPSTGLNLWQSVTNGPVDPSMWVREAFDLRGIAYDTIADLGYTDVRFRFTARFNFTTPPPALNFYDGWYLDSIQVLGSTCELNPPKIDFAIPNSVCLDKPIGSQVQTPGDIYPVSLLATDVGAGMDRVELIWTNKTTSITDTILMTNIGGTDQFNGDISSATLGDTICWYVEAYDLSCPNKTKSPVNGDFVFYVDSGLPAKCGTPFCGALPTTISVATLPWVETFEGQEWVAGDNGNSVTSANSLHRGNFPVFPEGYWVVGPSPSVTSDYAWCIANGGTATTFTGPNSNHTTGGNNYLYTEASLLSGNSARVITPCIDLTQNTKCLAFEFYYHMFGAGVKRLRVDIDTGSSAESWIIGYSDIFGAQQTSSTDSWQKAVVDLQGFNGKFIKIRLHAVRNNQASTADKDKSDIAVDDFRIFEPDPAEIEMLSFDSPVNGFCSYSATEPITITLRSNGCALTSAIPLAFTVNNGPIMRDTIFASTKALGLSDTIQYTLLPTANMSAFATYNIKAWSEMPGDAIATNDTLFSQTIFHNPSITTFPFIEDFEDGLVGQQVIGNTNWRFDDGLDPNFRWQIGEGMTSSRETGPWKGFHHGGKYLYTESGGPGQPVSTYFRLLCVDLSTLTSPTLDFYYHFFGSDIAGLEIQVSLADQDLETWATVNGSNVGVGQTEERDDWKLKRVNLGAYAGQTVKLRFKASRAASASAEADMAIDKIMIYDKITNDAGPHSITTPALNVPTYSATPVKPKIDIANFGTTNLTNLNVIVAITPYCGPNAGITATYTELVNTNITPGSIGNVTLNGFNLTYPVGEFEFKVYTNKTGDSHLFTDTISRSLYGLQIYDVPFVTNFDNCNHEADGFAPNNNNSTFLQWEFGTPSGNVISNAQSSPNAWVTNLDGNFLPATDEILNAPLMQGFDTLSSVELRFWQFFDFGAPTNAAGVVEYRNSGTWEALGGDNVNSAIGFNWLGSKFGTQNSPVFNGPAFEGTTVNDGGWIFTSFPLYDFNETANSVFRMRFRMKSIHGIGVLPNNTNNGWGIDDFELFVPGQNSASPIGVITLAPLPIPSQDQTLRVRILNTGAKILDSCKVKVLIDGIQLEDDWYEMPGSPMFTGQKKFAIIRPTWLGADVTPGVHDICVITYLPNNRLDDIPYDDTLKATILVLGEVDMTLGDSLSYCNDFEGTDPNITPWIALNSLTFDNNHSWEFGAPVQFDSAASGTNVWMTNLDSSYGNLDESSLFTPIFILDSGVTYDISFQHWFETEPFHDGGNLEVTFDGGVTWRTVGFKSRFDTNWYNTEFVTSLDIIEPGFSDTTSEGGWEFADHRIAFQTQGIKAIFRFKFATDYDINYPGWAIDDFCFREVTEGPQMIIGEEEYELPEQIVVADLSPNPTASDSELAIYAPTPKAATITIVNSIGQLMANFDSQLSMGVNRIQLDGSRWDAGMYIIKIAVEGETFTKKLIISK